MNTYFLQDLPVEVDVTFRLLLAFVLGSLVGWDRERDGQAAGLRTHILVSTGSAGFTLAFVYGFNNVGTVNDAARSASQIITGIGFLGAGVIWRSRTRVRGVTTAADIWVVSAIGLLAGAGTWYVASLLAFLVFITLRFLKPKGPALKVKKERNRMATQLLIKNAAKEKPEPKCRE